MGTVVASALNKSFNRSYVFETRISDTRVIDSCVAAASQFPSFSERDSPLVLHLESNFKLCKLGVVESYSSINPYIFLTNFRVCTYIVRLTITLISQAIQTQDESIYTPSSRITLDMSSSCCCCSSWLVRFMQPMRILQLSTSLWATQNQYSFQAPN